MSEGHRLIYYSRNLIEGSSEAVRVEIDRILAVSRRNNPRADLTGALMFNNGCFAQVLEGPRSGITDTFERIQRDARHGQVTVLEYGPVPTRSFAAWSMAFVGERSEDRAIFGAMAALSGFDPTQMDGESIFRTLQRLVREEERPAA
jgi:blue light- and temperature-responsive anti-repressor